MDRLGDAGNCFVVTGGTKSIFGRVSHERCGQAIDFEGITQREPFGTASATVNGVRLDPTQSAMLLYFKFASYPAVAAYGLHLTPL